MVSALGSRVGWTPACKERTNDFCLAHWFALTLCRSSSKVKVIRQNSRSWDKKCPLFSYGCYRLTEKWMWSWENQLRWVRQNAGGNDTVPISVWRGGCMHPTVCCCCSWLFVEFHVPKWYMCDLEWGLSSWIIVRQKRNESLSPVGSKDSLARKDVT